jgi:hypothetical protein
MAFHRIMMVFHSVHSLLWLTKIFVLRGEPPKISRLRYQILALKRSTAKSRRSKLQWRQSAT